MSDHSIALTASEALAAGLLTRICLESDLETTARSAAQRLAKLPPRALKATRELMRQDRHRLEKRAVLEANTFHELLTDEITQRRLKIMARASRMAIAG